MGLRSAVLRFNLTRTQTATVNIELDESDLDDVESAEDLDPWDWNHRAWEEVSEGDWEDYESDVESAEVYDYDEYEEDEEESTNGVDVPSSQPAPVPLSLALGHLIVDGDGDVYEVEDVEGEHLVLANPTTHERVDDYGGQERWKDGVNGGFRRWYRSGEHVYSISRSEEMTVKVVSFPFLTTTSGLQFHMRQTATWRWGDEVEEEATA